jgi:hypothetical protein
MSAVRKEQRTNIFTLWVRSSLHYQLVVGDQI